MHPREALHRQFGPAGDDGAPQIVIEGDDRHDQTAGKARAHALVDHVEIARRRIAGHHHLLGAGQKRREVVAEFGGRLALQELHVVDEQKIDAPQPFLEGDGRLALHRRDEMVHEVVGGQIDDIEARIGLGDRPGDGIEKMRFARGPRSNGYRPD